VSLLFGRKYIQIHELRVLDGRNVVFKLSYSNRMRKYFSSDCLYVNYDKEIGNVDKSVLYIPAVSSLMHLAWAIGADIRVNELDGVFLESLDQVKSVIQNWYPNFSFAGRVLVGKLVSNRFSGDGCALLFSGGLDSTVSFIRNKDRKPALVSIWGLDVLTNKEAVWLTARNQLSSFAEKEGVAVNFVKTNARQLLNEQYLSAEFGVSWWEMVSHGLTTIGLCAPLTKDGLGTVLIASTDSVKEMKYPWGSFVKLDNRICWADVKIVNDGSEFSRQEKIKYVFKDYVSKASCPVLRVCTSSTRSLNCGKCEKCLRTITGLTLENIDPNECGFSVDEGVWAYIEERFRLRTLKMNENLKVSPSSYVIDTLAWKDIQANISENSGHNLLNSRQFFVWLKNFDLTSYGLEIERRNEFKRIVQIVKTRFFSLMAAFYYEVPSAVRVLFKHVYIDRIFRQLVDRAQV
jgi:hypothetical protein